MKRFLSVILLALSFVIFVGCGNRNTVVIKGQDDPPAPETVVEIPLNDGNPFVVEGIRSDVNEALSVRIFVQVRQRDVNNFVQQYEAHKLEIFDRVTQVLSASSNEMRMEAGFITIKERTRRGINDILGTPLVLQVFVTGRSFETQ